MRVVRRHPVVTGIAAFAIVLVLAGLWGWATYGGHRHLNRYATVMAKYAAEYHDCVAHGRRQCSARVYEDCQKDPYWRVDWTSSFGFDDPASDASLDCQAPAHL